MESKKHNIVKINEDLDKFYKELIDLDNKTNEHVDLLTDPQLVNELDKTKEILKKIKEFMYIFD